MFKENREKVFGISIIIVLVINFFLVIFTVNTMNNRYDQIAKQIADASIQIKEIQTSRDVRNNFDNETVDFIKDQYSLYRDFADSDRNSYFNVVSLFFVALGILVTGGTIVLYWIFGQTKSEVKENANATIKASITKIEDESRQKIKDIIEPNLEQFENKFEELVRFLDNQYSLSKSKVIVLCPENKRTEMEELEVSRIRNIVDEVQVMNLEMFESYMYSIRNGKIDIIIYRYEKNGNEQEEMVRKYVKALKEYNLEIPFVIYAKSGNLVNGEDANVIDSYPYTSFANFPTSLTSNMISLLNVLSYERREKYDSDRISRIITRS